LEEVTPPATEVWPENTTAIDVFIRCINQWRVGFGGAYALDYNVFPIVAPKEYQSEDWPSILASVQVMEQETLELWAAMRDKK